MVKKRVELRSPIRWKKNQISNLNLDAALVNNINIKFNPKEKEPLISPCLTSPTRLSIQTSTMMILTSIVMWFSPSTFTKRWQEASFCLNWNGEVSASNKAEAGSTTKSTDLNLTSFCSEEPEELTLTLGFLLQALAQDPWLDKTRKFERLLIQFEK